MNYLKCSGRRLFILTGAMFIIGVSVATVYLMHRYEINFYQLASKGRSQIAKHSPMLASWLKPKPKFLDIPFDGKVSPAHPRIVLPQLQAWQGNGISPYVADRLSQYGAKKITFLSPCGSPGLLFLASCRLINNSDTTTLGLLQKLREFSLVDQAGSDRVSNAWQLAVAYDISYSVLSPIEREEIEQKLVQALKATLDILDEENMSLWHRRASHAAVAWLCAIVLDDAADQDIQTLRTRAQGHFLNAIDALAFTEVWPEGYNYWINERGFLYSLAASAYLNGLDDAQQGERIKQVMRQVGYWHIYATRPDNRIEGFGDEGPRLDLKDETRRVIDLIAQMTRDSVLAGYSAYLAKLYGSESYYRDYRWGFLLFNDPSIVVAGDGRLEALSPYLANAKLFGANSVNFAYLRSDWSKNATFVTYKAGHNFSHHGHYDAGHFTLFKGAPLIANSSVYGGDVFVPNRLNYSIRTVAKNSLLIERPGERVEPNRFFKQNVSDGGQRLTMPTGSSVLSVKDWYQNYRENNHYEAAELLNFVESAAFTWISSDLTPAYNNQEFDDNGDGGKAARVLRSLVYLKNEDMLIVYDRIKSTNINYKVKFLLHSVQQPKVDGFQVLKGSQDNGILESESDVVKVNNGAGYVVVNRLYPEDGVVRLIGGKDYQYYVESDGDDSTLDGKNFEQGAQKKPWFDNAQWRMELLAKMPSLDNKFLVAFSPSVGGYRAVALRRIKAVDDNAMGLETGPSVVIFPTTEYSNRISTTFTGEEHKILLVDFDINREIVVESNGKRLSCSNNRLEKSVEISCQEAVSGNVNIEF